MISAFIAILYAILAMCVIFIMVKETNKRIKSVSQDDPDILIDYYVPSNKIKCLLGLSIVLSAFCGFLISRADMTTVSLIKMSVCYMAVLAAAIIDHKTQTIPNYIPLFIVAIRLITIIYEFIASEDALGYLLSSILGCFACAFVLGIANKVPKGGIGGGDIKLLSAVAFMCGIDVVITVMLVALVSCIIWYFISSLIVKKTLKDHIPFGPYIYIGIVVMYLFRFT